MSLTKNTRSTIEEILTSTIRNKLDKYNPETNHMPFHYRLLGRDRYATYSFIQSMNTTFGMSIWEQIAVAIAKGAGFYAERQYKLLGSIDDDTERLINDWHYRLRKSEITSNIDEEFNLIKENIQPGKADLDPDSVVDLFIKIGNRENYFDITSAKPNMKEFSALKLKLLRWTSLRLSTDNKIKCFSRLAIPYNPYHPEPYERWTLTGLYDLDNYEILIGNDFWNFVANDDIYEELLDLFQTVGEKFRNEIDNKFDSFRNLSN